MRGEGGANSRQRGTPRIYFCDKFRGKHNTKKFFKNDRVSKTEAASSSNVDKFWEVGFDERTYDILLKWLKGREGTFLECSTFERRCLRISVQRRYSGQINMQIQHTEH